ncbi:DEAD/DEAH box helicase [Pseudomonas cichorii]|nr:DEAD/DEAH box helicase [Pseudomonas cichorii]MBX8554844.1 DEAD/DEAH box helicase [Pseudomonas cichorii]
MTESKNFSFAAPTSMGKSFVILEMIRKMIANTPKSDIVVLVPTRALIAQVFSDIKEKLGADLERNDFQVATSSYALSELNSDPDSNFVFILTPERLLSLINSSQTYAFGYLFVDEAQKLSSQKDHRSIITYQAIEQAIERNKGLHIYFSSPNVSNPESFLELFGRNKKNTFKSKEGATSQHLYFVNLLDRSIFQYHQGVSSSLPSHLLNQYQTAHDLFFRVGGQSPKIIYGGSVEKTLTRARSFKKYLSKGKATPVSQVIREASQQVREYIHPDYELASMLEMGIAFHFGGLPQAIRTLIESLFRDGEIRYLFCTPTLLEGVNLPAKTIFVMSSKKGTPNLEPIDFWNLAGRAGRLAKEFSGNIVCIKDENDQWNNLNILTEKSREITLTPTVLPKNRKEIENVLATFDSSAPSPSLSSKISDILRVDSIRSNLGYDSYLYNIYKDETDGRSAKLAAESVANITIPISIARSNQYIDLDTQNSAFKILKASSGSLKLSQWPTMDEIDQKLHFIFDIYNFEENEKKLKRGSIVYFRRLIHRWIMGDSLSSLISNTLATQKTVWYRREKVSLDTKNPEHISAVVNNLIANIEHDLRFVFENYLGHYYQCLQEIYGDDAGANWAQFIEFGTNDKDIAAMQVMGLARHTAVFLKRRYGSGLSVSGGKIRGVNFHALLEKISRSSIYYTDIRSMALG